MYLTSCPSALQVVRFFRRGEPQVHAAAMHRTGRRYIGPGVPHHGVVGVVAVLRVVRPRRAPAHPPAASGGRAPAGLLRARRAGAAAGLPGHRQLCHRHAHC